MIEHKHGDILKEDTEAVVNTVNCVGVMGRGIALQFKNAFPENFKAYVNACKRNEVRPGKMFVFKTGKINPRYIINFPTKRHWHEKSRIEDIESGLDALVHTIHEFNIRSLAIPPLGSGLGGLNWAQVRSCIEAAFNAFPNLKVIIYEPNDLPEKIIYARDIPRMTPGRAALLELAKRYLNGLMEPFITLLELHKLMYFMQEAGEPLKLRYKKAIYGPYAENLRHVLNAIEGYFIYGYTDGGDDPNKQLRLIQGATEEVTFLLKKHPDTLERVNKVACLVEGFESPFGLELLSTVHWVMKKYQYTSIDSIVDATYAWNNRKRQFTPRQINLAVEVLSRSTI